jgi:hypothetical protein
LCGTSPEDGTTYFRNKVPLDIIEKEDEEAENKLDKRDLQQLYKETETSLENQSLKLRLSAAQTQLDEQVLLCSHFSLIL